MSCRVLILFNWILLSMIIGKLHLITFPYTHFHTLTLRVTLVNLYIAPDHRATVRTKKRIVCVNEAYKVHLECNEVPVVTVVNYLATMFVFD